MIFIKSPSKVGVVIVLISIFHILLFFIFFFKSFDEVLYKFKID